MSAQEQGFYLAGGTGLALRLGHRSSRDLDWFTGGSMNAESLKTALLQLGKKPSRFEIKGLDTLRAYYGEIETSFLLYNQVQPRVEVVKIDQTELSVTLGVQEWHRLHP